MTRISFEWNERKNRINQMKAEYDLSKMKSRPNPYAKRLKRQVTIRMGVDVVGYFQQMAKETGIPYQNLIDLYLSDCVQSRRKLRLQWAP
ncbi:MAG: hypothetical protein WCB27_25590 [Thermoguttaceae bacterium]